MFSLKLYTLENHFHSTIKIIELSVCLCMSVFVVVVDDGGGVRENVVAACHTHDCNCGKGIISLHCHQMGIYPKHSPPPNPPMASKRDSNDLVT